MLYPLKFTPIYKSKIWGGTKLNEVYSREIPATDIGESWEVTCREDGMSVVSNGTLSGMTMQRLIDTYGNAMLGRIKMPQAFPLLLKFLDVNSDLSVQVHPTAQYIEENAVEGAEEKNEMWYVLYAEDNAHMISGVKSGTTKETLAQAITEGKIEDCLETSPVKTGDVIMIKAGSVHAACAGMLLFELQQSSDTTYRLYDYNRKDASGNLRRLDVDKALGTINYERGVEFLEKPDFIDRTGFSWRRLVKTQFFTLDEILLKTSHRRRNAKDFSILTCVDGEIDIIADGNKTHFCAGETIFMPACIKIYTLIGEGRVLVSSLRPPENYT